MQPDIEKYRKYVDKFDLTEDQKVELIHTVWRIMESFVDRAFGIDSVQQILEAREAGDSIDESNRVESEEPIISDTFKDATEDNGRRSDYDEQQ